MALMETPSFALSLIDLAWLSSFIPSLLVTSIASASDMTSIFFLEKMVVSLSVSMKVSFLLWTWKNLTASVST